jgi:hypothetical protein
MPGSQEYGDGSSRIRRALLADPRRNTSKDFFETSSSGDKAETCIRFVSSLSPLFVVFIGEVDTKRRQGGDMFPLVDDLTSINRE